MKDTRPLIVFSIAAIVGIGLGLFVGSLTLPDLAKSSARKPAESFSPDSPRALSPVIRGATAASARSFQNPVFAAAALRQLRDVKNPRVRTRQMHELCAALDARGAAAWLAALGKGGPLSPFDRDLANSLIERWAELDPRAAADFAAADLEFRISSIQSVVTIWAESDLAAAKQWALQVRDREAHQYSVNALVNFMAETDPQAAFAFIEELPPTENRSFYVYGIFHRLGQKNPALAAKLAPQMATRELRDQAVREVASTWGEKEPGRALAWYLENTSSPDSNWQGDRAVETLMKSWIRTAPDAAAAFAGALPPGQTRTSFISKLGESWGAVDPEAAARWLQGLPKSSESFRAFDSLVGTWTKDDPARAASFILSQPADRSRDWLLNTLGSNWAENDPAAALAWARQQNDPEIERRVATEAIGAMAAKDLANAASYLSQLKDPGTVPRAVESIAYKIADLEPERAARWVLEMAAAQRPIGGALDWPVQRWSRTDPEAVGAWINGQEAGALKDTAIGSHARALALRDPAAGAEWATTIGDEDVRQSKTKEILSRWARNDRTAARTWVQQQPTFTEPERQALLQTVDPMGAP